MIPFMHFLDPFFHATGQMVRLQDDQSFTVSHQLPLQFEVDDDIKAEYDAVRGLG